MTDFVNPPARPDAGQPSDFAYVVRPGATPLLFRVPVGAPGPGGAALSDATPQPAFGPGGPGASASAARGDHYHPAALPALTPITNTYTASGPVAVTDRLAVLNATATLAMTLAAPTVDGQPMTIKRRGIGGFSLTLTLDDVAGNVLSGTGGSTAPKDVINLIGVLTPTPTWLLSA